MTSTLTKRSQRKRDAILMAAADEFLAAGFSGTSMDRIAEVADVSKKTVYSHFESKEALFEAIVAQLVDRINTMPHQQYDSQIDLATQLGTIGQAFADTVTSAEFLKLARIVLSRYMQAQHLSQATLSEQAKLRANCIDWLNAGTADGRLCVEDAARATAQFYGLIKELVFWPQLVNGDPVASARERADVVQSAVQIFLAHYATGKPMQEPRKGA